MPNGRRAIIHIGTPKTGTTSIQRFLSDRRDALQTRGFHYAVAPGKRNHIALAAYGGGEGFTGNAVRRAGGGDGDGDSIGPRLARAIADEVAALPPHIHTVLYSSEQLATRLDGAKDVARLRTLLDPCFDRCNVIVYLRRQDEVAVSKYSTSLRAGGESDPAILPPPGREGLLYHLHDIVDGWAAVFGREAVMPRIFERSAMVDGDVVADYLAAIGLEGLAPEDAEPTRNPALNAETQELVRRFNALVETRGLAHRPRIGPLLRDARFQGKPRLPTRAAAAAFLARFAEGNERLRATFFPERASLFHTDFSRYPEREDAAVATVPTADAVLDVAMEVLVLVAEELRQASVAALARDARDAVAAGREEEARRRWTKVLHIERDHREAVRAIAGLDTTGADATPRPARPTAAEREARKTARRAARAAPAPA